MIDHESIADKILSIAIGGPREPPVDLINIAQEIGVSEVLATRFPNGFTDFRSDRPMIYLNRTESSPRMRVVFAHELAHVMLRMPAVMRLGQMPGRGFLTENEEELADLIATTMLLPSKWIEMSHQACEPLERLQDVANYAQVPPATLVSRMSSLGIDVALLHWRKGNVGWQVIDRPGVPRSFHGPIEPTQSANRILESLQASASNVIIDARVNGFSVRIAGRGRRNGVDAFQFFEPSRDILISPQSSFVERGRLNA